MNTLTVSDFASLFGAHEDSFSAKCRKIIESKNFEYSLVSTAEEKSIILNILKEIDESKFSSPFDLEKWNRGWGENLSKFKATGNISSLLPVYCSSRRVVCLTERYVRVVRLMGRYVAPDSYSFEQDVHEVMRCWLFQNFASGYDKIYEFGCGTGLSILYLSELFPGSSVVGLDWSPAAVEIINLLSDTNPRISAKLFNAFEDEIALDENSCVITAGFMEQLSDKFSVFLESVIKSKVTCINIEPIEEFYDKNTLFDYMAYKYHQSRGYLKGFSSELKSMNGTKLRIIKEQKVNIGNIVHDGRSLIIWETI